MDFAENTTFSVTNTSEETVIGKIYTLAGHITASDSIGFSVAPNQTEDINWNEPNMAGGEGSFEIRIDAVRNQQFGYFTNGAIPGDNLFVISVGSDTISIL